MKQPELMLESAIVFRTERRRYFTFESACRDIASREADEKYPCTCEPESHYYCHNHDAWLEYRDKRLPEIMEKFKAISKPGSTIRPAKRTPDTLATEIEQD